MVTKSLSYCKSTSHSLQTPRFLPREQKQSEGNSRNLKYIYIVFRRKWMQEEKKGKNKGKWESIEFKAASERHPNQNPLSWFQWELKWPYWISDATWWTFKKKKNQAVIKVYFTYIYTHTPVYTNNLLYIKHKIFIISTWTTFKHSGGKNGIKLISLQYSVCQLL